MLALVFKMDLLKLTFVGAILLLSLDVIHGWPITGTPGVGIQDVTGSPLFVHCQSKDDDLGARTLQNNGVWRWNFKPNLGGSTLWWCDFKWNGKSQSFTVWDIDTAPIYDRSINDWRVAAEGFSLYDPVKEVWNTWHFWNNGADQDSANEVRSFQ